MESTTNRQRAGENLIKWILDQLGKLRVWQRWVEQRLREMQQGSTSSVAASQNAGSLWDYTQATICVAKVTTEVQKATSTTRPGKGTLQQYQWTDLSTTPATLNDLTGVDEPCCSINQEKKIAVNSTVIGVKFNGVWYVATPDSCASLLS